MKGLWRRLVLTATLVAASWTQGVRGEAAPVRIASINMCADQLLLALADPDQIAGLGPYARDPQMSWLAEDARRYPRLSGEAEDLIALNPDLVLAGKYGKKATRDLLRDQGVKVAEFDIPRSIEDVKEQIRRVGEIVGHPERASALNARIDASAARARAAASQWRARVLAVSRRGWVAGSNGLLSSLLATVGLSNSADELGLRSGGFVTLETIIATQPDLILVAESSPRAEDQGQAMLLHPALERDYPAARRIVIPEQLTICGGPMLPAALDRLSAAMARISR
ncbi:iron ABC transporter [Rhodoblastus sphagnicola]|uniref:Iron ABC transporter n=1 Tax=Rhodoblastus sphagnicola TaxID=333368 RepID=A0A2S6MXA6_9HYPH|nr:ABC transporter substrate-binding protein [Rhodoblastus sphagnicola]MBB4199333.1 iron complex transport system substrate-binding protein [Rhodoblastus sphagnicola]PPQ26991.1 iron ABC transporter [Rhodoblastus sphagnicola]